MRVFYFILYGPKLVLLLGCFYRILYSFLSETSIIIKPGLIYYSIRVYPIFILSSLLSLWLGDSRYDLWGSALWYKTIYQFCSRFYELYHDHFDLIYWLFVTIFCAQSNQYSPTML